MLAGVSITITQRAGEEGHLFGSVTAKDIADALERQNYTIDRRKIQLDEPIKNTGEYKVPVRLHREVTTDLSVNVVAE
jgi:large subunit ribosomal protein L9